MGDGGASLAECGDGAVPVARATRACEKRRNVVIVRHEEIVKSSHRHSRGETSAVTTTTLHLFVTNT